LANQNRKNFETISRFVALKQQRRTMRKYAEAHLAPSASAELLFSYLGGCLRGRELLPRRLF